MNELISLVVPCYNCQNYIEDTLDSIMCQTYKNFEVICIDDGSTDKTLEVLNKYIELKGDNKIRVYSQKNCGVSATRNKGINLSNGEYLVFIDSDDAISSSYLNSLLTAIDNTCADTAYCKYTRNKKELAEETDDNQFVKQELTQAMQNLLYRMKDFGFVCYLYKLSIIRLNGIFFDEDLKYGEDRSFNWKYLCHCKSAALIDSCLYWYRVNPQSATKHKPKWNRTDSLLSVERTARYLSEADISFYNEYENYMYARDMWAVAKAFSVSSEKELFKKLSVEYDVKKCMLVTRNDKNSLVRLASRLYLINPFFFYFSIRLFGLFA